MYDLRKSIQYVRSKYLSNKVAFAPTGSMPAMDPSMMGGAPAGAPPMDPAMMGGQPPMDPSMMGGQPPMDPAMMGGAPAGAPPVDPSMMGMPPQGMPIDPSMMGMPPQGMPMDPAMMGGAPDPVAELSEKVDKLADMVLKICRHFDIPLEKDENGADALVSKEDQKAVEQNEAEEEENSNPLSDQAQEAIGQGDGNNSFIAQQLSALGGNY